MLKTPDSDPELLFNYRPASLLPLPSIKSQLEGGCKATNCQYKKKRLASKILVRFPVLHARMRQLLSG